MLFDCRTVAERDRGIEAAIAGIERGDLVVLPTDTVYGIAADAFKPWSVSALLNAKGRGRHVPPPVLVGSRQTLDGLVFSLPREARDLVEAFWPGALTVVVEQASTLQWDIGDNYGTIAVRMPLHPVALEVLQRTGPLAVSSASRIGMPPAATAALSGPCSNQSSSSSQADRGNVRRNSIMSRRPRARNFLPRFNNGRSSPSERTSTSGAGTW